MPDWQRAEDYQFLEALDNAGLAWEFLRRNPEYQLDWVRSSSETFEWRMYEAINGDAKAFNPASYYDPPRDYNEPYLEWSNRALSLGYEAPGSMPPGIFYGSRWHLGSMSDPWGNERPWFSNPSPYPCLIEATDITEGIYGSAFPQANIAMVAFDLSRVLHPQLNRARELLESVQSERQITVEEFRDRADNTNILRTFDGRLAGARYREIAAVLYPDQESAVSRVRQHFNSAKRYFNHYFEIYLAAQDKIIL